MLGLVTVEECRRTAWMNHPNFIRIVSPEWGSWLRLCSYVAGMSLLIVLLGSLSLEGGTRDPVRSDVLDRIDCEEPGQPVACAVHAALESPERDTTNDSGLFVAEPLRSHE